QMATFLIRGFGLAASTTDSFIDDQDSVHQADINAAALAGVTQGCGGSNFCPDRTVTREQMAAFLRRAMQ
ncbi:MAG: S-layer homology domain-containing protein, partial [Acidimicrobiia bacterium]